ncbi:hypothetical protein WCLP8_2840002 [uncultured Gammaproteobacteria bacterium]
MWAGWRCRWGYGNFGTQNSVGTIDGFDTATGGMAVGADTRINDNIRIGVAFNYSATGISQSGTRNGDKTDIDSYGGTLYGSYTGNPWYVDGMFNYTRHQYKDQRSVAFTGFSDALSANYGADQFTVRSEAGYPVQVGSRFTATPFLNLTYSNVGTAAYTETGGAARMIYASTSSDSFKTGLGGRVSTPVKLDSGATLTPELSLAWSHEFMDDTTKTTGTFAAGGPAITTTGIKSSRDAALFTVLSAWGYLRTGLTYMNDGNDAPDVKSDYFGHTGRLQVRYDF